MGNQRYVKKAVIPYSPLENIDTNLLTASGLRYVWSDENLNEKTVQSLLRTEQRIVSMDRFKEFSYLLDEHDTKAVVRENFYSGNMIGVTHVAALIKENIEQSMADLVAAYSDDRGIPFIIGLILLRDLKKEMGFCYCNRTYNDATKYVEWTPKHVSRKPPVNLKKVSASGKQSIEGYDDNYIVSVLRSVGCNRKAAAELLDISRQTLTNRLYSIGYLMPNGKVRPDYDQWVMEQIKLKNENPEAYYAQTEYRTSKTPVAVSRKRRIQAITYEEIKTTYIKCKYRKADSALQLGISYPAFKKRLAEVYPGADSQKGVPDGMIIDIYREYNGDVQQMADYLNISPGWLSRRIDKLSRFLPANADASDKDDTPVEVIEN